MMAKRGKKAKRAKRIPSKDRYKKLNYDKMTEHEKRDYLKVLINYIEVYEFTYPEIAIDLLKIEEDIKSSVKESKKTGLYDEVYNEMYDFGGLFTTSMDIKGKGRRLVK